MNLFNIIKFGLILILLSLLSILFNIVMGFIGIQFFYGTIVAVLITIISIYFKVILPLYIGSFFGMIYVMEWHRVNSAFSLHARFPIHNTKLI